jgi:phosphopantothenoylcysteine decarboxylase/phosphopantothenate--cysteine ligase
MAAGRDDVGMSLDGYEVLVAVCGGIAAFKTATLVSRLVQAGAGVSVAMTKSAQRFITPLTFESLTARPVFTSLWKSGERNDPQHLSLTESADLFIIAPATANIIGKITHGIADEVVSTLALSAASPLLLAPAMNTRMWENPAVQDNLQILERRGVKCVGPGEGWLACRTVGMGRMAEPEEILQEALALLKQSAPKRKR